MRGAQLYLVRFDGVDYAVLARTMVLALETWLEWNRSLPEEDRADEPVEFDQVVHLDVEQFLNGDFPAVAKAGVTAGLAEADEISTAGGTS